MGADHLPGTEQRVAQANLPGLKYLLNAGKAALGIGRLMLQAVFAIKAREGLAATHDPVPGVETGLAVQLDKTDPTGIPGAVHVLRIVVEQARDAAVLPIALGRARGGNRLRGHHQICPTFSGVQMQFGLWPGAAQVKTGFPAGKARWRLQTGLFLEGGVGTKLPLLVKARGDAPPAASVNVQHQRIFAG
ncbi:hypothetical protein D3C73_850760 [compost metagenome]